MSLAIEYPCESLDAMVTRDFLPPPQALAFCEQDGKVTIALSNKSIDFLKSEAAKHNTQYQRMLRKLIDSYVDTYAGPPTARPTKTVRKRVAG